MKNLFKITFLACALYSATTFAKDESKIIATYKHGNVTAAEVAEQFKMAFELNPELKGKTFNDISPAMQEMMVKGYINMKLLDEEIKKNKIEESKEFTDKLNNVKKEMAQNELINKIITEKVTDNLIDEEYAALEKEMKNQEEVKVKHILVKSEKEAQGIKQKIDKGQKFEDLAKKLSQDPGSKAKGGELGYILPGETDQSFEKAAFAMKKGEVSSPVKSEFGWHVIKLEDRRKAKVASKEEAMNSIKARLQKAAIAKYLEDLSANADVKILIDKHQKPETNNLDVNNSADRPETNQSATAE
jgi:peptidylprolyl isomerase/peptidyl-prolyl cis-trans isomerase C